MKIQENILLSELTTMQIGGTASFVLACYNRDDIRNAIEFAKEKNLPWFVMGGGSNILASGDYYGVIILNRIKGFKQLDNVTFRIGAGEKWDKTVAKLCAKDLSGVECLSLIPGVAGATPVQNVGAYGQDISQTLVKLTAFDTRDGQFKTLTNADCKFAYRSSIFKSQDNRHYIICDITLRLKHELLQSPFYPALEKYLEENSIFDFSPVSIRQAVINIRNSKLPPVDKIPNTGSFFKNPLVASKVAEKLLTEFPSAPHWDMPDGQVKLSAGWLIDQSGLKGYKNYGFQVYPKNALVITNITNGTAADLAKFKAEIIAKVKEKFGVTLEQEPENL